MLVKGHVKAKEEASIDIPGRERFPCEHVCSPMISHTEMYHRTEQEILVTTEHICVTARIS